MRKFYTARMLEIDTDNGLAHIVLLSHQPDHLFAKI